jgi:hypothetical protein
MVKLKVRSAVAPGWSGSLTSRVWVWVWVSDVLFIWKASSYGWDAWSPLLISVHLSENCWPAHGFAASVTQVTPVR